MRILLLTFVAVVILATTLNAQIISSRLSSTMDGAIPGQKISIIVTLSDQADLSIHKSALRPLRKLIKKARRQNRKALVKQFKELRRQNRKTLIEKLKGKANKSQQNLLRLLRANRASNIRPLWIVNGIALDTSPQIIRTLAAMPQVASITTDAVIEAPQALTAAIGDPEESLVTTGVPDLWALGFDGQGVVVASMDTGVDINHSDLTTRWRGGTNSWYDPNGEHLSVPFDSDGHGTGTMGVMVGGNAGGSGIGVAPGAQWIAVKIFNDAGFASNSKIHEGFQWLLDPDSNPATDDAPDIVNNSWSFELNSGECIDQSNPDPDLDVNFHPDIMALRTAGIEVVFSAGNSGPGGIGGSSESPGNYPEAFAVGSVGAPGSSIDVSSFSSRGPSACDGSVFPALVAPGYNITLADLTFGGLFPESYRTASGTSFSAPYAAGVMALLLQAFPATTLTELEETIAVTATDLGVPGPDNDYGSGLVDPLRSHNYLAGMATTVDLNETAIGDGTFDYQAAASGGGSGYEYKFWLYDPASGWSVEQDYSATATWSWDPTSPALLPAGAYYILVYARSQGSIASVEAYKLLRHVIETSAATDVTLSETAMGDGTFTYTAAASGGGPGYEYKFLLYDPESGWSVKQDYSATATWNWNPASPVTLPAGAYYALVYARSQGSTAGVEAYQLLRHVIASPPATDVTLSETAVGDGTFTYTAAASGGGPGYEYKFLLYDPESGWSVKQDYSATATWNWNPASPVTLPPGDYYILVYARSQGSITSVEAYKLLGHVIETPPATDVTLSENDVGDGTFIYTAAASGGGPGYEYKFWLYDPATGWSVEQDYSATATWRWNPTSPALLPSGAYYLLVYVRSQGSISNVEAFSFVSHILP